MNDNKVLIKLIVPDLNKTFDAYIPVNERIYKTIKLITKAVSDLSGGSLNVRNNYILINLSNCREYKNNEIVLDTEIRNGTELVLLSSDKNMPVNNNKTLNIQTKY